MIAIALAAAGLLLLIAVVLLARGPLRAGATQASERTSALAVEFWDWLKRGR